MHHPNPQSVPARRHNPKSTLLPLVFLVFLSVVAPTSAGVPTTTAVPAIQPASIQDDPRIRAWGRVMLWGIVLVLIFLVGMTAIIIFSRRYMDYLNRTPHEPTSTDDVWSMHRLPSGIDSDESTNGMTGGDFGGSDPPPDADET